MPMRACVCTACLVSVAGGVGCPGDPRAGGETRGPALMVEPRAGCAAAWASPFRAACETSAHKSFGDSCLLGRAGGCPGWACGLCLPFLSWYLSLPSRLYLLTHSLKKNTPKTIIQKNLEINTGDML